MMPHGLERPSRGSVRVAGHELTQMNEDALTLFRRDNVGIVFQAFHLVPTMTALENVAIPLEFAGRKDAFDRARDELVAVGLGHRLSHYPSQLSGGEQAKGHAQSALMQDLFQRVGPAPRAMGGQNVTCHYRGVIGLFQ